MMGLEEREDAEDPAIPVWIGVMLGIFLLAVILAILRKRTEKSKSSNDHTKCEEKQIEIQLYDLEC